MGDMLRGKSAVVATILAFADLPHEGCHGLATSPRRMPPMPVQTKPEHSEHDLLAAAAYGPKRNHPTAYDESPPFKGPLVLGKTSSPDQHRQRIRRYYTDSGSDLQLPTYDQPPRLPTSSSTERILRTVVDHLAHSDCPVDAKEVAESVEFYHRTAKRLLGAAKRITSAAMKSDDESTNSGSIVVQDLCCGHGLTGMLFVACNPPRSPASVGVRTVLVDRFEPPSHKQLRHAIAEVCPWMNDEDAVSFVPSTLDDHFAQESSSDAFGPNHASVVISTHACGSLTDDILRYAVDGNCAALAVMPCCYTGTDKGVPYGIRRALGVSVAADVGRSFFLQERGYHVDWTTIPQDHCGREEKIGAANIYFLRDPSDILGRRINVMVSDKRGGKIRRATR